MSVFTGVIAVIVTVLLVGISRAGLIVPRLDRMDDRLSRVEQRLSRLEGLIEGLFRSRPVIPPGIDPERHGRAA